MNPGTPVIAGQNNSLLIDTASAGKGALSVGIKAAGHDVKHSIKDIGQGKFEVSYFPLLPIPHKVDVKYNNSLITNKSIELAVRFNTIFAFL